MERMNIGFIPEEEWMDVGREVYRPSDPLDAIIGDERTGNIHAAWQTVAAEYRVPIMAKFHGFDTEAGKTFHLPVDAKNIEKGLIKVKLDQSERMRMLMRSGVRENELEDYVLSDGIRLADQVVTRTKVAKAEMIASGKVTIKENGLDLTVDYGVPKDQVGIELDLDEGADIPTQIGGIVDKAAAKGLALNGLVTSRAVIGKLRRNKSVQGAIFGGMGIGPVNRSAIEEWLSEEFGIMQVITDDLTYGVENGYDKNGMPKVTQKRYFPEDTVSFFAANAVGRVGVGLWGDPPEADLTGAQVGKDSPFVYVTQYEEKDPAVLWTKASALFIPVLYDPDRLWIAKVSK